MSKKEVKRAYGKFKGPNKHDRSAGTKIDWISHNENPSIHSLGRIETLTP